MSAGKEVAKLLAESTTKDLPLGTTGKRWSAGHRLAWRLQRPREQRQVLKENQTRHEMRTDLKQKKMELYRESKQIDVYPMPRFKETKHSVDFVEQYKQTFIHPGSITIEEKDLISVTPETLPILGRKIKDMRATGESWSNITLAVVHQYTSHLTDPRDAVLKKGLVKAELRRAWNAEVAAMDLQRGNASTESSESNSTQDLELHPSMTEEWSLDDSNSPHPAAAQELKQHLHSFSPKL